MSNVLGEFCVLVEENSLDLVDFRDRWLEPAVAQILDALRDGVLKGEDKLRRDTSLWLKFLRMAMFALEQDEKENGGQSEGAPFTADEDARKSW